MCTSSPFLPGRMFKFIQYNNNIIIYMYVYALHIIHITYEDSISSLFFIHTHSHTFCVVCSLCLEYYTQNCNTHEDFTSSLSFIHTHILCSLLLVLGILMSLFSLPNQKGSSLLSLSSSKKRERRPWPK